MNSFFIAKKTCKPLVINTVLLEYKLKWKESLCPLHLHTHTQAIDRRCVVSYSDVLPVVEVQLQIMSPSLLGRWMHVDLNYTSLRPDGLQRADAGSNSQRFSSERETSVWVTQIEKVFCSEWKMLIAFNWSQSLHLFMYYFVTVGQLAGVDDLAAS